MFRHNWWSIAKAWLKRPLAGGENGLMTAAGGGLKPAFRLQLDERCQERSEGSVATAAAGSVGIRS